MSLIRIPGPVDKADLVGHLLLVTLTAYDPAWQGSFGVGRRATVTVHDCDTGLQHTDLAWFGTLAKQIAEHLLPGQSTGGRIVTGKTPRGQQWYGFDSRVTDDDWARIEAAAHA